MLRMKFLVTVLLFSLFATSFAANVSSGETKVSDIRVYSDYGDSDTHIILEASPSQCSAGFWVNKTHPGYEAILSVALAAMHSGTSIIVIGQDDQRWAGSSGNYCKVYNIKSAPGS